MENMKHRTHIASLPMIESDISHIFQYPRSTNIAIALPVFCLDGGDGEDQLMWARASVWTALKYIQATDVVEQGVPIYFLIGEEGASRVHDILDAANIPTSLRVTAPQKETIHFAVKWSGIFDNTFDVYASLIVVDIDSYPFFVNKKYRIFEDLLARVDTSDHVFTANTAYRKESRPPDWSCKHMTEWLKTYDKFWEEAERLYPSKNVKECMLNPDIEVPAIGGWFVGFPKKLRQHPEFREMFFRLAKYSSLETTILEIYLLGTDTRLMDYNPRTLWVYERLEDESTLSHIYTTNGFEWEDAWKKDCLEVLAWAIGKEKAVSLWHQ